VIGERKTVLCLRLGKLDKKKREKKGKFPSVLKVWIRSLRTNEVAERVKLHTYVTLERNMLK
jgi:hypothetical protein